MGDPFPPTTPNEIPRNVTPGQNKVLGFQLTIARTRCVAGYLEHPGDEPAHSCQRFPVLGYELLFQRPDHIGENRGPRIGRKAAENWYLKLNRSRLEER